MSRKPDTQAYCWVYLQLEAVHDMWEATRDAHTTMQMVEDLMDEVGDRMADLCIRDEADATE